MVSLFRRLGALVATLAILVLAVPACMSTLDVPAAPPVVAVPTAAPTLAPIATATPAPPTQEPPAGPAYSLLDGSLAAGWTPAARDLTISGLYRRLSEQIGGSCRIHVVTGQAADGQVETADVWVDCEALP